MRLQCNCRRQALALIDTVPCPLTHLRLYGDGRLAETLSSLLALSSRALRRNSIYIGADRVARKEQFHATILLAAFCRIVRGDGLVLPISTGLYSSRVNALLHKVIANGLGAMLGKLLVVVIGSNAVGGAFDGDMH